MDVKEMSTREFNEMARDDLGRENKYKKQVFSTLREVCLYEGNSDLLYTFDLSGEVIKYEPKIDGKKQRFVFTMDKQTKKIIRKMVREANMPTIKMAICGVFCVVSVFGLIATYQADKVNKQVKKYEKTLPNWNDSIRLAKTDVDYQHAKNMREQQMLKIKHFKDSIRGKNGR